MTLNEYKRLAFIYSGLVYYTIKGRIKDLAANEAVRSNLLLFTAWTLIAIGVFYAGLLVLSNMFVSINRLVK